MASVAVHWPCRPPQCLHSSIAAQAQAIVLVSSWVPWARVAMDSRDLIANVFFISGFLACTCGLVFALPRLGGSVGWMSILLSLAALQLTLFVRQGRELEKQITSHVFVFNIFFGCLALDRFWRFHRDPKGHQIGPGGPPKT